MPKYIFLAVSVLLVTGCGQTYQANILNTKSESSPTNVNINLPETIDDETFLATERKAVIAHMNKELDSLQKDPKTERLDVLAEDIQKLLMNNPYDKSWNNQMDILTQQLIQLKVMVTNKEGNLESHIKTMKETLNGLN